MRLTFNVRHAIASAIRVLDSAAFVSVPGDTDAPLSALRAVLDADDEKTAAAVLAEPGAVVLARIAAQHARQRDAAMAERDELAAELAKRGRVYVFGVYTLADYSEHETPKALAECWHVSAPTMAEALALVGIPDGAEVFVREAAELYLSPATRHAERIDLCAFDHWVSVRADEGDASPWQRVAGERGAVRAASDARFARYFEERQAAREAAAKRAAAGFAAMADAVQSFEPEDVPAATPRLDGANGYR